MTTTSPHNQPRFSFIIPVYNRPQEIDELLQSLCLQTYPYFEVIVVEDGSSIPCEYICRSYSNCLDIHYHSKPNEGPGPARNYGAEHAIGEYLLIVDSDVILPPQYLQNIIAELEKQPADAFGGPDRAHLDFTPIQKAINYAMTSFFTTGGIRGGKKKMDKFYPRSFNLGVRRQVFYDLQGFSAMRFGEDIDFSIRIFKAHYTCRLFPEAWVWHKRRANFRQFFKQVHNSGIARIHLYQKYPNSLKIVHLLPTIFTLGIALLCLLLIVGLSLQSLWAILTPLVLIMTYSLLIGIDATIQNHSIHVGSLSIVAAFVQLLGYGTGFLRAVWHCLILRQPNFQAFRKTFYK